MLALVESGLYVGFLRASSALIGAVGGDLWVMGRATKVLDDGPLLPGSTRALAEEHPCVARVRAVGVRYLPLEFDGDAQIQALLVGYEPDPARLLPWQLARGLPGDLHGPLRVSVDDSDLHRLHLEKEAIGAELHLGKRSVRVAAITSSIKSFSLSPYLMTEIENFHALARTGSNDANYWVIDLRQESCIPDVRSWVERHPKLQVMTTNDFARMSEDFWVLGSGVGPILGFSALLGLIVGSLIVAQTLHSVVHDHLKELGMLKALGSSRGELASFVGWQAGFLALAGGTLGLVLAWLIMRLAISAGLSVVISPGVIFTGALLTIALCMISGLNSLRTVLKLDPAEVFK